MVDDTSSLTIDERAIGNVTVLNLSGVLLRSPDRSLFAFAPRRAFPLPQLDGLIKVIDEQAQL